MIRPLEEVEKEAILAAVRETRDVLKAAAALGIGKTTLYRKLHQYGYSPKSLVSLIEHVET
jgi:transcriptional regulator of acetoin/glycerol metabolism